MLPTDRVLKPKLSSADGLNPADKKDVEHARPSHCCPSEDTLDEYVRHRLTPAEVAEFERHLLECERCADELQQTRLIVKALREAAPMTLPRRRGRKGHRVAGAAN
jgi:hypothetical protein